MDKNILKERRSFSPKKVCNHIYSLHDEMLDWVKKTAQGTTNLYGSRRMKHAMNYLGFPISRQRARKLMNEAGAWVKCRKKYKVTTDSNHNKPLFKNVLKRQFDIHAPVLAYLADITYIWTREGWLYLAVVIFIFAQSGGVEHEFAHESAIGCRCITDGDLATQA